MSLGDQPGDGALGDATTLPPNTTQTMPIQAQHGSVLSPEILGACVVVGVGDNSQSAGRGFKSRPRLQVSQRLQWYGPGRKLTSSFTLAGWGTVSR